MAAAMKRTTALILSAALVIAALSGAAQAGQNGKTRAMKSGTPSSNKYRVQNPEGFNPQPDPPSRKFLGGPDTKSLGGPDTKTFKRFRN